jgi:hypothetical protein
MDLLNLFAIFIACGITFGYYFTRNWLLNNIIAIAFIFLALRLIKISSFRISSLLLGIAFFYDIFWVFYSPNFFSGKSVMAEVATKVDLPIKLVFP